MAKYYAVKNGRQKGVFTSWSECENQVKGFSGAQYRSFTSLDEAKAFIDETNNECIEQRGLIAYVDGSYNIKTKEYGYGCVLIEGQRVIGQYHGKGNHKDYVSMRNVAGEISGSHFAIDYAIKHNYPSIVIYYDYEGIEKWANGVWKTKKVGTQTYQHFIAESRKKIQIYFVKVLAHSGDYYNEMADQLAKKAVGI